MKDQNPVLEKESTEVKWNRAVDIFIESVYKPDNFLRSCAYNQHCHDELMQVREQVLDHLRTLRH